jgi:hypothetical protein
MSEPRAVLAEKLTALVKPEPGPLYAHFLVEDKEGTILCADRRTATWAQDRYKTNDHVREILEGEFVALARDMAKWRQTAPKHTAHPAGALKSCLLSHENWVVCVRLLNTTPPVVRFLVGINVLASEFAYGASRPQFEDAVKLAEIEWRK